MCLQNMRKVVVYIWLTHNNLMKLLSRLVSSLLSLMLSPLLFPLPSPLVSPLESPFTFFLWCHLTYKNNRRFEKDRLFWCRTAKVQINQLWHLIWGISNTLFNLNSFWLPCSKQSTSSQLLLFQLSSVKTLSTYWSLHYYYNRRFLTFSGAANLIKIVSKVSLWICRGHIWS